MIRTSLRFTTLCAGLLLSASALALSLGDLTQNCLLYTSPSPRD